MSSVNIIKLIISVSSQLRNTSSNSRLHLLLTAGGDISSASDKGPHSPEVRARLESGPCAAAHSPLAERNGFLQLRLHGYRASFLMSTLQNLAHFLEDDSAPQVLPMEISVRDTHINLKVTVSDVFSSLHSEFCFTLRLLLLSCSCKISARYLSYWVSVIDPITHCHTAQQLLFPS